MRPRDEDRRPPAGNRESGANIFAGSDDRADRTADVVDLAEARQRRAARLAWAYLCASGLANEVSFRTLFGEGRAA